MYSTDMKKVFLTIILLIVGLGVAVGISRATIGGNPSAAPTGRLMSIESYVAMNISELSPIKETVGGKFYVTNVEAHDGEGVVSYEDGHNAYTADFAYEMDETKGIAIKDWKVRQ